jgi:pimeloyl-ACP methyl ester carboxylesterase
MSILSWRGLDVDYTDDGQGPAVILIHGGASNYRQWEPLIDQLKDRYRVLAVNLRSTGKTSTWPVGTPQPLSAQTTLIEALADLVGEPVSLVGHSWGGTIAMKLVQTTDVPVDKMVLIEPNPFFILNREGYEDGKADLDMMAEPFKRLAAAERWSDVGGLFIDYWFGTGSFDAMGEKRQASIVAMLPEMQDAWEGLQDDPAEVETWSDIADRTLLITSADTRLSVKRIRDQMRDHLPGLTCIETPEGGHMAAVSRPDLVNPDIIRFLDQAAA